MTQKECSLREKILQTVMLRHKNDIPLREQVGGIFFGAEVIQDVDETSLDTARELLARHKAQTSIPPLIAADFENGCGSVLKGLTVLPFLSSLGATADPKLAYDYGKATALEALSIGANWSFSPVADLLLNPRNPIVNVRSLTDDPDLACKLLPQVIRGMQENGLAACAKHFPGDGVDYRDQHITTTCNSLSMEDWWKLSGRVFEEMIRAGVMSIMPGHITLPAYQQERSINELPLPATLSSELMEKLLKKEMGFGGVVISDALDMGGFNGWYSSRRRSEVEAFKAGCDMMLWPTEHYVDDMVEAIENGYVPMERLDDAVERIFTMKEKLGLFEGGQKAIPLSREEQEFVLSTQQKTAENSITLVRDNGKLLPVTTQRYQKITVIPIAHHIPAFEEAELLCRELEAEGFQVRYCPETLKFDQLEPILQEDSDLVIFALFSKAHRPIGFLDFHSKEAMKIWKSLYVATEKSLVVSFGSPHFGSQYFEKAPTYVNAYSMLSPSVKAFVKAATGKVPFGEFSPVKL